MARLPNIYYQNPNDGLAKAAGSLAEAFLSGPSAWEKDYLRARSDAARARADKDRAETESERQRAAAPSEIADIFRRSQNLEAPRPSSQFVGPMPPASPDQAFNILAPDIARTSVTVADEKAGSLARMFGALMGVSPNRMAQLSLGAGGKYADTQPGFEAAEANDLQSAREVQALKNAGSLAELFAKPVEVDAGQDVYLPPGHPLYSQMGPFRGRDTKSTMEARVLNSLSPEDQRVAALGQPAYGANETQARGDAFTALPAGRQAVAVGPTETEVKGDMLTTDAPGYSSDERKRVTGALPSATRTPRNYLTPGGRRGTTLDGVTDAATGTPLPQGSQVYSNVTSETPQSVEAERLKAADSRKRFRGLLEYTRGLAKSDPLNFGFPGFVKGKAQDVRALLTGVSQALGYDDAGEALVEARNRAIRSHINPELVSGVFDPTLPQLQSAADLLTFSAAEALANQQGRSISDRDIQVFRNVVGHPDDLFTSQEKFLAKLGAMESVLSAYENSESGKVLPSADADTLTRAREAIRRGADPAAVRKRLIENGMDPAGL